MAVLACEVSLRVNPAMFNSNTSISSPALFNLSMIPSVLVGKGAKNICTGDIDSSAWDSVSEFYAQ